MLKEIRITSISAEISQQGNLSPVLADQEDYGHLRSNFLDIELGHESKITRLR